MSAISERREQDEVKQPATTRARVQKHREGLRAQGLRPIQIWVADARLPGFAEEARRQCLAVRADPQGEEVDGWIEQSMDYRGWE